MSRVYLVRHGQAGTRQNYDCLSDLGRRQARLLGEYFAAQGISFHAAHAGSLTRQQQTAQEVAGAYSDAGLAFPAVTTDPAWNEFDLDRIYRELAPILSEEDAGFRAEYEAMRAEVHAAGDNSDAEVHRRWTACDVKTVQAWIKGHPRYPGESFRAFHERIAGCRAALAAATEPGDDHNIVVFTSGTPIGIWAALGLDVEDHRAMRLAGVLHNASFTVMRLRHDQLRLHAFNAVPHLAADLLSYR
ncbi:MAG TPA: histidine phosphatase family protein [Bryobacteraceae bacterium]|nr:histidine phosphatase family protein [Bryobacteraceae bacterium]